MGIIKILPREVHERIAAGEVIDRPASVVRELIDNSIDAQSTDIKIHIKNGGIDEITVSDNGTGMENEDLKLCFLKYATSKIASIEDLTHNLLMGFRGEALSSIALVSQLEIESRCSHNDAAYKIAVAEDTVLKESFSARTQGTSVVVKKLFYNMPARQKFLKSSLSEFRAIKEVIIQKALAFPYIHFTFLHNDKKVFFTKSSSNEADRIEDLFHYQAGYDLLPVENSMEWEGKALRVNGFIGKPHLAKPARRGQYFFVNHRWIVNSTLSHALSSAMVAILPEGMFTPAFLYLTVPADFLDVNIHPAKKDIKFLDEKTIHRLIYYGVSQAISDNAQGLQAIWYKQTPTSPMKNKGFSENKEQMNASLDQRTRSQQAYPLKTDQNSASPQTELQPISTEVNTEIQVYLDAREKQDKKEMVFSDGAKFRIAGILFDTFILLEGEDEMLLIDQHAAHERINYEIILQQIVNGQVNAQKLLFPFTIEVNPEEVEYVDDQQETIKSIGLSIKHFGGRTFAVEEIPFFFNQKHAKLLVEEYIESIIEDKPKTKEELVKHMVSLKACRQSIKAGDYQSLSEAQYLIQELLKYPRPFTCPHGRPIALRMTKEEIYKKFQR